MIVNTRFEFGLYVADGLSLLTTKDMWRIVVNRQIKLSFKAVEMDTEWPDEKKDAVRRGVECRSKYPNPTLLL